MDRQKDLQRRRKRKSASTRRKVLARPGRARIAVFRSNRYIYAQVIDDSRGHTVASASSRENGLGEPAEGLSGKTGLAHSVGVALAERAKAAGVEKVVFDRRYYKYHGRIKALAEGARKGGLKF